MLVMPTGESPGVTKASLACWQTQSLRWGGLLPAPTGLAWISLAWKALGPPPQRLLIESSAQTMKRTEASHNELMRKGNKLSPSQLGWKWREKNKALVWNYWDEPRWTQHVNHIHNTSGRNTLCKNTAYLPTIPLLIRHSGKQDSLTTRHLYCDTEFLNSILFFHVGCLFLFFFLFLFFHHLRTVLPPDSALDSRWAEARQGKSFKLMQP